MTQRTKAELDAFFVDNTLGLITPAMLRDFVESCTPGAAGLELEALVTDILAPLTWTKAANLGTLHDASRFSRPVAGRLRYDGVAAVRGVITATLTFTCAADDQLLAFALAKNGAIDARTVQRVRILTGAHARAVSLQLLTPLAANDYLEVFVSNDTSDADITIDHGHVLAVAHLT